MSGSGSDPPIPPTVPDKGKRISTAVRGRRRRIVRVVASDRFAPPPSSFIDGSGPSQVHEFVGVVDAQNDHDNDEIEDDPANVEDEVGRLNNIPEEALEIANDGRIVLTIIGKA